VTRRDSDIRVKSSRISLQCPCQAHVELGVFKVALVVVFIVVAGDELGEVPLPEHMEAVSPTR